MNVLVHQGLAEAALRANRTSELVLWLLARSLQQTPGANAIPRRALVRAAVEEGLFSESYARELLRSGRGTFWHLGERTAFLIGMRSVARKLGARHGGPQEAVPLRDLVGRAGRRGRLLSVALQHDRPESQARIRQRTGVSERSQRRYLRLGCFGVRRQTGDLSSLPGWLLLARDFAHLGVFRMGGRVLKRLSNVYVPRGERLPAGRRAKRIFGGLQPLHVGPGCQSPPKVWFQSAAEWRRYRRPKLGTSEGERFVNEAHPLNAAFVSVRADLWEAVRC